MPMKAVYDVLDGEVLGETRGGAGRTYVPDPLGSTAALIDSSQNITDEWEYWPYGEVRSHTGSSATPLTFGGTLGYYMDSASRCYVRARVLDARDARWTTVDPLWPEEPAYGYAGDSPLSRTDGSGLVALRPCFCSINAEVGDISTGSASIRSATGEGRARARNAASCNPSGWTPFVCGKKVPAIPWPLNWICKRYCEAASKAKYCETCYGLCNLYCTDDGDMYEDIICHADCHVRYLACKRSKKFPPVY
jgi:RHS repeat-associated protein